MTDTTAPEPESTDPGAGAGSASARRPRREKGARESLLQVTIVMEVLAVVFGALVAVSAGEALKAVMVSVLCFGVYWGAGTQLLPRTNLRIDDVGGMTKVIRQGGLQAESLDTQERDQYDTTKAPQ